MNQDALSNGKTLAVQLKALGASDTVRSISATEALLVVGYAGIGEGNASFVLSNTGEASATVLVVDGSIVGPRTARVGAGQITGSNVATGTLTGTNMSLPFNLGALNVTGSAVGVGTASPGKTLDVSGDVRASGNMSAGTATFGTDPQGYVSIESGGSVGGRINLRGANGVNTYVEGYGGTFRVVKSDHTAQLFSIDQSGNGSFAGNVSSSGPGSFQGLAVGQVGSGYSGDASNLAARTSGEFRVQSPGGTTTYARFGAAANGGWVGGSGLTVAGALNVSGGFTCTRCVNTGDIADGNVTAAKLSLTVSNPYCPADNTCDIGTYTFCALSNFNYDNSDPLKICSITHDSAGWHMSAQHANCCAMCF
jgi:hypothetical protein